MKKKIVLLLLIIPLIIIFLLISAALLNNHILSNNFKNENIEIFIPSGIANKYRDAMVMSFDDLRTWTYSLNRKENEIISEEILSAPWKKLGKGFERNAKFYFTDDYWPENMSDSLYYCLYDLRLNEFIYFDSDVAFLGWHRLLFLYDADNYKYYCVSMSI